jgi:hypothetical protein
MSHLSAVPRDPSGSITGPFTPVSASPHWQLSRALPARGGWSREQAEANRALPAQGRSVTVCKHRELALATVTSTRHARTAWAVTLVTVVLLAFSRLLLPPEEWRLTVDFITASLGNALIILACAGVGLLITSRRPDNPRGWRCGPCTRSRPDRPGRRWRGVGRPRASRARVEVTGGPLAWS